MKKTITAILLGILLVGTLGVVVVGAVTSNDTKANNITIADNAKINDDFEQMHNLCGKYMNSETMHNACSKDMSSGAMHSGSMMNGMQKMCNEYMNSGTLNSNDSNKDVGQTNKDSINNQGHLSHH